MNCNRAWIVSALCLASAACRPVAFKADKGSADGSAADGRGADGSAQAQEPFLALFSVNNVGSQPLFFRKRCGLELSSPDLKFHRYDVAQAAATEDVSPGCLCACPCEVFEKGGSCAADCAGPATKALTVEQSGSVSYSWSAKTSIKQERAGQTCNLNTPLAAGLYQVSATVYESQSDADVGINGREVTAVFNLPAGNKPVRLIVGACKDPALATRWSACRAATSEAECTVQAGSWANSGASGFCTCDSGQAGCACASDAVCLADCWVPEADRTCATSTRGICSSELQFGCLCLLSAAGAAMECRDPP
jgi:hypothetical protein